jgi:Holliday junction resolvase RusA-like endonuclease
VTTFHVLGKPVTQGSKVIMRGRLVDVKAKELKEWRSKIADIADPLFEQPITAAVFMDLTFFLPKPKTVKRLLPFVKPDSDKLTRAVFDALTGVAYVDDCQVTDYAVRKRYGTDDTIGVVVTINRIEEES